MKVVLDPDPYENDTDPQDYSQKACSMQAPPQYLTGATSGYFSGMYGAKNCEASED